jgi:hypothetical protein
MQKRSSRGKKTTIKLDRIVQLSVKGSRMRKRHLTKRRHKLLNWLKRANKGKDLEDKTGHNSVMIHKLVLQMKQTIIVGST